MLKQCPECQLQVSSKAITCPHCGFPLKTGSKVRKISRTKRMRLPNGFGTIEEIRNRNLRKPFYARVSLKKNSNGKPIYQSLKPQAYFKTYNEAYEALVEYHKNPYDLNPGVTVKELYEKWTEEYFKTLKSASSYRSIESAWSYASALYNMRVKDVRARHIKGCIDDACIVVTEKGKEIVKKASPGTKCRMKSMWNLMLDYAVEYELTDRNYARTFNLSQNIIDEKSAAVRGHLSFTDEEMKILWKNVNVTPYVDVVILQCYMGWRPQELGLLKLEDVDLTKEFIVGGMKTEAGFRRIVPIHPVISNIVKRLYEYAEQSGSEYLINCTDSSTHKSSKIFTYDKYNKRFSKIVKLLGLNPDHRPHDGRKQFVTMCKKYNVDEYAIKRMVGHAITDITEKVYTDRPTDWLHEEIAKIPCGDPCMDIVLN